MLHLVVSNICKRANFSHRPCSRSDYHCHYACLKKSFNSPPVSFVIQRDSLSPYVSISPYPNPPARLFPACRSCPPHEARATAPGIRTRLQGPHTSHQQLRRGYLSSNNNTVRKWTPILWLPPGSWRVKQSDGELELARKSLGENKLQLQR